LSKSNALKQLEYLPTPPLRPMLQGICSFWDILARLGLPSIPVDSSRLRRLLDKGSELARKVEGEDWASQGDEIHRFWEAILTSVNKSVVERNQHAIARLVISGALKFYLERRVKVYQYLLDNPKTLDVKLDSPLIIAGFPRTGSTLLHRLLSQDSNARAYQYWELTTPTPSPIPNDTKDWRIRQLAWTFKALDFLVPGHTKTIEAFHMASPTTVEEDTALMWSTGLMNPLIFLHGDSQLRESTFSPSGKVGSYRFLRRCCQILNAKYPSNAQLRLKSPFHSLYIDALFEEFPDARLITIHRDPQAVVKSWLSFVAQVSVPTFREQSFTIDEFSLPQLEFLERSGEVMAKCLGTSGKQSAYNHLPLSFTQFVSDPIQSVDKIYRHFNLGTLSNVDRGKMIELLSKKEAQKTMLPNYQLSELGIDADELSARFTSYNKAFGHLY